jgi:hypothetical protein
MNERDFPHLVELELPPDPGNDLARIKLSKMAETEVAPAQRTGP